MPHSLAVMLRADLLARRPSLPPGPDRTPARRTYVLGGPLAPGALVSHRKLLHLGHGRVVEITGDLARVMFEEDSESRPKSIHRRDWPDLIVLGPPAKCESP